MIEDYSFEILNKDNLKKILLFRNQKEVREASFNTKIIQEKEHLEWFNNKIKNPFFNHYVLTHNKKTIGLGYGEKFSELIGLLPKWNSANLLSNYIDATPHFVTPIREFALEPRYKDEIMDDAEKKISNMEEQKKEDRKREEQHRKCRRRVKVKLLLPWLDVRKVRCVLHRV